MSPEISVVVPVFDEEGNVAALAREIAAAFEGRDYEMVFVDDRSRDATLKVLQDLKAELPRLRVLSHARNAGQSRAVRSGVMASRGSIIVTLDGDGQNDPADAPRLVDRLKAGGPELGLVGGCRAKRKDTLSKRLASRFGNKVRNWLLRDDATDTGCGLKVFRREVFLAFPYFDHIHRFLPAMTRRDGLRAEYEDVNHRPRGAGVSKYSNLKRAMVSVSDLMGVMWLQRRARNPGTVSEA
jgi:glycosyltransferase involved in cell wall biosynthesis